MNILIKLSAATVIALSLGGCNLHIPYLNPNLSEDPLYLDDSQLHGPGGHHGIPAASPSPMAPHNPGVITPDM